MLHHQVAGPDLMGGGGNDERTHQVPLPDELAAENRLKCLGSRRQIAGSTALRRPVFPASPEFIKVRHTVASALPEWAT